MNLVAIYDYWRPWFLLRVSLLSSWLEWQVNRHYCYSGEVVAWWLHADVVCWPSCGTVQSLLLRGWMTWDSFTHKKAILIGGFIFAWNISSYSSRLWGGKPQTGFRIWSSHELHFFQHIHSRTYEIILVFWLGAGFILVVWFKLYQQSNPARFEKALADMGGSSAIDHIDRKKSLQHAMMVFQVWLSCVFYTLLDLRWTGFIECLAYYFSMQ